MKSVVCTLFENHLHYGLGVLANSLSRNGYRGVIWAGFRGKRPPWARPVKERDNIFEYQVSPDCSIRFVPLSTDMHFTHYKPDFMLDILRKYEPDTEAIFYFDPDIVVKCNWHFFEEWVTCGVALCEDVNSPVPQSHPLRAAWRNYYEPHGFKLDSAVEIYVNGGFLGITRDRGQFLEDWKHIQELMAPAIGGLKKINVKDRTFLFYKTDQDALNVALMQHAAEASLIGKDGMDFAPGGFVMSHAWGPRKPWIKLPITEALVFGMPPTTADKAYWKYAMSPIKIFAQWRFQQKRLQFLIASAIGRVIRRH